MSVDRCVMCGTVVPEGQEVCLLCEKRYSSEPIPTEFVCEVLAELFGHPCNFSPPQEELHRTDVGIEWCEKNCNKVSVAMCWEHYFRLKFAERSKDNENT